MKRILKYFIFMLVIILSLTIKVEAATDLLYGMCPNVNYYKANADGTLNYNNYMFAVYFSNEYAGVYYKNNYDDSKYDSWGPGLSLNPAVLSDKIEPNYSGKCANWVRLEGSCYVRDKDNFDFSSIKQNECASKITGDGTGKVTVNLSDETGAFGICRNTKYYKANLNGTLDSKEYIAFDDEGNGINGGSVMAVFWQQFKENNTSNMVETNYEGNCANWIRYRGSCYVKDKDRFDFSALSNNNTCLSISSSSESVSSQILESPSSSELISGSSIEESSTSDDHEKYGSNIVYIMGMLLLIIRIVVPILLIVIASTDLIKAMNAKDESTMKPLFKPIILKLVAAIIIFLLPSIIALVMKLVNQSELWDQYSECLSHPVKCDAHLWEGIQ